MSRSPSLWVVHSALCRGKVCSQLVHPSTEHHHHYCRDTAQIIDNIVLSKSKICVSKPLAAASTQLQSLRLQHQHNYAAHTASFHLCEHCMQFKYSVIPRSELLQKITASLCPQLGHCTLVSRGSVGSLLTSVITTLLSLVVCFTLRRYTHQSFASGYST